MDDPSKRDAGYEYSYIYMAVLPVRIYNPACFYPGSHLGSFELFLSGFPLLGISEWTDEWTIPQKGMEDYSTVQYDSTQYTPIQYFTIEPFLSGFPFLGLSEYVDQLLHKHHVHFVRYALLHNNPPPQLFFFFFFFFFSTRMLQPALLSLHCFTKKLETNFALFFAFARSA
jgi:hypothetical protein